MLRLRDKITVCVFCAVIFTAPILFFFTEKSDFSEDERRALAGTPELCFESVSNGSYENGMSAYISDHFPYRPFFVTAAAYMGAARGNFESHGIYLGSDGYCMQTPFPELPERAGENAVTVNTFAKNAGIPVYMMTIPQAGDMLSDKLNFPHRQYMYDEAFEAIKAAAPDVFILDMRDRLTEISELAYYKTDHHLTSLGTYALYSEFTSLTGFTPPSPLSDYEKSEITGFTGTAVKSSGFTFTPADTVEIYSKVDVNLTLTLGEETYDTLFFYDKAAEHSDAYQVFLGGVRDKITVKNDGGRGRLLIIGDSYATCFTAFAAQDMELTELIDLRYWRGNVFELITENNYDAVLVLYGIGPFSQGDGLSRLLKK